MDGRENIGMEDKKLFWISDVAKMFHVSAGTLRHYEQAGLLAPEYTDPDTGYRYYGIRQFEVLNTIRYLRVLDLPLSQIAEFLQNRDTDVIEEKLEKQKALIQQKKRELEIMERKIDHRIEQIRDEEDHYDGQTELLPSMECATMRFCGGHKEAPQYYQMLLNFLKEKHLMSADFSQEITLIDDGMTSNPEKFVTEIRLPVRTAMNR